MAVKKLKGFQLPIQTVTIVPCTQGPDKVISASKCKLRAKEVKNTLSKLFGGYTEVKSQGGYYSDDKKKVIEEPVYSVTAYATEEAFKSGKKEWLNYAKKKGREWKQESMGLILENDLTYIETKEKKKKLKK